MSFSRKREKVPGGRMRGFRRFGGGLLFLRGLGI
jgi:hypothetical protein